MTTYSLIHTRSLGERLIDAPPKLLVDRLAGGNELWLQLTDVDADRPLWIASSDIVAIEASGYPDDLDLQHADLPWNGFDLIPSGRPCESRRHG